MRERFDGFRDDLRDEWGRLQQAGQNAQKLWEMVGGHEVPGLRERVGENVQAIRGKMPEMPQIPAYGMRDIDQGSQRLMMALIEAIQGQGPGGPTSVTAQHRYPERPRGMP